MEIAIVVVLASIIWALVDAASRPQAAWDRIGYSKSVWLAVQVGAIFAFGVPGLLLAWYYLLVLRRRLRLASQVPTYDVAG